MKIALVGYGKMGQAVEKLALANGDQIVGHFGKEMWKVEALKKADVCIEFTQPDAALQNIEKIAPYCKKIVIGTTGWFDRLEELKKIVDHYQLGVIYAPNFALGVAIFQEVVKQASKLFNQFTEYDAAGVEYHHCQKKDAPSGLAHQLSQLVEEQMPRIGHLPFSSVRCGDIFGEHTLLFDSPYDTLTFTHTAKNRIGFAAGALQAAKWIKKRQGLFTFHQCIQSQFKKGK